MNAVERLKAELIMAGSRADLEATRQRLDNALLDRIAGAEPPLLFNLEPIDLRGNRSGITTASAAQG